MLLQCYTIDNMIKSLNDVKSFAYRVKHHARNFPPSLDLLIALILYLSTDAKPRCASLPPALSSWRAFGL